MTLDTPRAKIALFLVLTLAFSSFMWVKIIAAGSLRENATYLMWCPGLAAIVTRLVTQRNLRGQGWRVRRGVDLATAYLIPLAYAVPVYVIAWASGLGAFRPEAWTRMAGQFGWHVGALGGLISMATIGMFFSLLNATGEEIGWRGLLVPELAKRASFRTTANVSGVIWGVWHLPVLVGADYNGGATPVWFSMLCFMVLIVSAAWIAAWLRLRSGSLWPAALFHAAHNLWVQGIFDAGTRDGGHATWWTGEFGAGMAITGWIVAWYVTRRWPVNADAIARHEKRAIAA